MSKYKDPNPTLPAPPRLAVMPPSELSKMDAERARALQGAKDSLAFMIEYCQIDAKQKRAKFLALTKEGFTEQQALELCK